jgi:hypothetical protein
VTVGSLKRANIDLSRLNAIFAKHGAKLATQNFEFKKVNGDAESPDDFAILIRRRNAAR